MKSCVYCGIRFQPTESHHELCGECIGSGVVDGSEEQYRIVRALALLRDMAEQDAKMVADSAAWGVVAFRVLSVMDSDMMRNLLRKVMRNL